MKSFTLLLILSFHLMELLPQTGWKSDTKYLKYNNKEVFLNGVNYVPSKNWQTCLISWDASAIEKDFVAMESIGIKCVRWFPLWHLIQPEPDKLDEKAMTHIIELFDIAQKHNIYVQLAFMSGWMSGFTFLPEWADGNIFTDPKIIEGEKFLIRELTSRVKNHPALQGYDFGNEMNVLVSFMKLKVTPEQIDEWMQTIYKTFKTADPDHPVTNGIGTGFDQNFDTRLVAKSSDYLSNHSYPFFHRTIMLDPKMGQRTTYSSNFITSWCKMEGKPVLIQEIGSSEGEQHISDVAKFLRVTMHSNWADGAAGYFWWCSNDIDPDYIVPSKGVYLNYSVTGQQNRKLSRSEGTLGLFDVNLNPKASALEYKKCVETIDKLGLGWEDQTPVCYIIVPENSVFDSAMIQFITPYTLLKQNHVKVNIAFENRPVPADASAVVVAGFSLSPSGIKHVGNYLNNGGTVYQSYYNDFKPELIVNEKVSEIHKPLIWLSQRTGSMRVARNYARVPDMMFKDVKATKGDRTIATKMTGQEKPFDWDYGKGVYIKTSVGMGTYLYFGGNLEKALELKYNPWTEDDSYELYAAICPEHEIYIDNKLVEFYHKKRANEEIIILINHDNSFQDVIMRSNDNIQLFDSENNISFEKNTEFYFRMKPAEVSILYLKRQ